jgi:hypothetical protein
MPSVLDELPALLALDSLLSTSSVTVSSSTRVASSRVAELDEVVSPLPSTTRAS